MPAGLEARGPRVARFFVIGVTCAMPAGLEVRGPRVARFFVIVLVQAWSLVSAIPGAL